ncbi:MAG: GNAT family N-acetyltransferase [Oscillospiraceae bacterium]|jgi:RimJ/RimL family protein N-acetyltransferase|nr:GNAT family N-acetyltransferase [Oscillospiraceae bacterium]
MSEPAKKANPTPESHSPKDVPEILRMAGEQRAETIGVRPPYISIAPHTLETDRLILRKFRAKDWKDLQEIAVSNEASPFANCDHAWATDKKSAKDIARYFAQGEQFWAAEVKASGKVVCFVNFNSMNDEKALDIGHVMNGAFLGDAYDYEALRALYAYAFAECGAESIVAGWALADEAKLRPLRQLGMVITETSVGPKFRPDPDGSTGDFEGCILQLKKEDFLESHSPKDMPEILRMAASMPTTPRKLKRRERMIEVQNVHLEQLPPLRFIGKRYTNADRDKGGGYGAHWKEWHDKGWFAPLEALPELPAGVETGYVGFMRCNNGNFEYWIGTFDLPTTAPPEGYEFIDLPASTVGVCWLYGREKDGLYGQHDRCAEALKAQGWAFFDDPQESFAFERYNGERFKDRDGTGRVILDYGIRVKQEVAK